MRTASCCSTAQVLQLCCSKAQCCAVGCMQKLASVDNAGVMPGAVNNKCTMQGSSPSKQLLLLLLTLFFSSSSSLCRCRYVRK
jgi:hypothetical protein